MLTLRPPPRQQPPQPLSDGGGISSGHAEYEEFLDPVTYDIIVDPVVGNDGCTYDRISAYELMTRGIVMPGCREPFKFGADNVHFRSR